MRAPLANPLQDLVGYQLRRASAAAMDDLGRELAGIELRPIEASVLLLVGANPGCRSSEIGRELGIQRANMTPLVSSLERRGLLAREPVDGRSQSLSLTAEGQAARNAARCVMQANDERLLRRLGPASASQFAGMLRSAWMIEVEAGGGDLL